MSNARHQRVIHTQSHQALNNHATALTNKKLDEQKALSTTSNTHLSTAATKLTNIQTITDTKLSAIQTFLDKDSGTNFHNAQIHTKLDTANSHKADHTTHLTDIKTNQTNGNHIVKLKGSDGSTIHGDGSGNIKANIINSININPANSNNGDHASFNNQSVSTMLRARTNITDNTTGKFLQCNTSGQLNTNVVNSVNTEIHAHTDIADTNTSVRLKGTATGSLVVEQAPFTIVSETTLGNTNRLDNSASSGLSDTIDMNGFNNLSFSVK